LTQWDFQFDNASRRAGCCNFQKKTISLSYEYARFASDEHVEDALLHEISHAIVGKKHNHDAVWRAKALELGCSGERCHDLQFTPPRYIVTCENYCWIATAERRQRNRVCATCRGKLVYSSYTEERWEREQKKTRENIS
jgi:predicted SprT family Zn-dependent metalloprotease